MAVSTNSSNNKPSNSLIFLFASCQFGSFLVCQLPTLQGSNGPEGLLYPLQFQAKFLIQEPLAMP